MCEKRQHCEKGDCDGRNAYSCSCHKGWRGKYCNIGEPSRSPLAVPRFPPDRTSLSSSPLLSSIRLRVGLRLRVRILRLAFSSRITVVLVFQNVVRTASLVGVVSTWKMLRFSVSRLSLSELFRVEWPCGQQTYPEPDGEGLTSSSTKRNENRSVFRVSPLLSQTRRLFTV